MASATSRFQRRVVERLQPVVRHLAAARIGAPRRRNARRLRQRLVDDVGMRRRRLERATGDHCRRDDEGGAHQPENGYSQLYHVYPRMEILRSTTNGLSGLV